MEYIKSGPNNRQMTYTYFSFLLIYIYIYMKAKVDLLPEIGLSVTWRVKKCIYTYIWHLKWCQGVQNIFGESLKGVWKNSKKFFYLSTPVVPLGTIFSRGGSKRAKNGKFWHEKFFRKSKFSSEHLTMGYKLLKRPEVPQISTK